MGKDPAKFTDDDFNAAIDKLQKAKDSGQLTGFTGNDYTKGLSSGDIAACMAWTGDVVQLQADNPDLGYVLPDTGHMLWSDNFLIPNAAQHKKNAEMLINYYYDPAVVALVEDYVNYISPVEGRQGGAAGHRPDYGEQPADLPRRRHAGAVPRLHGPVARRRRPSTTRRSRLSSEAESMTEAGVPGSPAGR